MLKARRVVVLAAAAAAAGSAGCGQESAAPGASATPDTEVGVGRQPDETAGRLSNETIEAAKAAALAAERAAEEVADAVEKAKREAEGN